MSVACLTLFAPAVISSPIIIMSEPELSVLQKSLATFDRSTITSMTVTYDGTDPARLEYENDDDILAGWLNVLDPITIGSPVAVSLGSALVGHDPILTPGGTDGSLRAVTSSGTGEYRELSYTLELTETPSLVTIAPANELFGVFWDGVIPNLAAIF
jgi:hypothetical protein